MNYKILAVTLARSGSKGIKDKNIYDLCGHPLISYTIHAAKQSKLISKYIISTDSLKYKKIFENYGAEVPFLRPKKLAKDHVWSRDALKHAVIEAEKIFKEKYDFVIELPAIAPLRAYRDIDNAIQKLIKSQADSVIAVCQVRDKHPVRIKKIKNGMLKDYNKSLREGESSRRQDLPNCYVRNGSIYAMRRDIIVKDFSRKGKKSLPYIMDDLCSINIDEYSDLYLAETLIKKGFGKNFPGSIFVDKKISYIGSGKKKVLVTYPSIIAKPILKKLKQNYFKFILCDQKNISNLKHYEKRDIVGWITSTDGALKIDNQIISIFKNIKYLLSPSTGLTHISHNIPKSIKIINLDKKMAKSIMASSEFTIGQIINLARNTIQSSHVINGGNWRNKENDLRGHELSYFSFGIFGLGRIGKNIAKFLKNLDLKVSYFDPFVNDKKYKKVKDVKKFLNSINFLIISAKLTKNTKNFFKIKMLKNLKKGSIVLNISRGELINEHDLIKLIRRKYFYKVGLDVLTNENKILQKKNKIINLSKKYKNLIVTPHMAGLTYESEKKAVSLIVKELISLEK